MAQQYKEELENKYADEFTTLVESATKQVSENGMSHETQAYLTAVSKLLLSLYSDGSKASSISSLLERIVGVRQNDLTFQFLKALNKQLSIIKCSKTADPKLY